MAGFQKWQALCYWLFRRELFIRQNFGGLKFCKIGHNCAGSSGAVHNVVLIDVYLDLENPGGRDFGWGSMEVFRITAEGDGESR